MGIDKEISELDRAIERSPGDARLYMKRGKMLNRAGDMGAALNDFLRVKELEPENTEAGEHISMLNEIFKYRYKDIYNP